MPSEALASHVRFGRARVLAAADYRLHTGSSVDDAREAFERHVPRSKQRGSHLVVLLHGYGGKATRMSPLRDAVREAGMRAEVVQYPSLFRTIDETASSIVDLVEASAAAHGQVQTVSMVGFSMGGLVASQAMRRLNDRRDSPKIGRLVTIGTPHGGSRIADLFKPLTFLGGPNVSELAHSSRQAFGHLKGLRVPVGVVAGVGHSRRRASGRSPKSSTGRFGFCADDIGDIRPALLAKDVPAVYSALSAAHVGKEQG